jgi:hypothetical protein
MMIELMFYLPNRFRHMILMNFNNIAFFNAEDSLLTLMTYMFNLQDRVEFDFRIKNFIGSYKLFFASTMLYESLLVTTRIKLYEKMNERF